MARSRDEITSEPDSVEHVRFDPFHASEAAARLTIETVEPSANAPHDPCAPGNPFAAMRAGAVMDEPPMAWIIRGVAPRVGVVMIYADPKTGKSLIVKDLAAAMIGGFRFMGEIQSERVDYVVYMSGEGRSGMGGRLHALLKAHPDLDREELRERFIVTGKVVRLATEEGDLSVAEFGEWVRTLAATVPDRPDGSRPRIVFILDTWANAALGIDSNDAQPVGDALNRLNALAQETGVLVVIVHHSNKTSGFMGSQAFYASVDLMFEVRKREEGGTLHLVGGKDSGGFSPRDYKIVTGEVTYFDRDGREQTTTAAWIEWTGRSERPDKPVSKTEAALEDAIRYLRDNDIRTAQTGIELADLWSAIRVKDSTLRDAIRKARTSGDERISSKPDNRERKEGEKVVKRTISVYFSPFAEEQ